MQDPKKLETSEPHSWWMETLEHEHQILKMQCYVYIYICNRGLYTPYIYMYVYIYQCIIIIIRKFCIFKLKINFKSKLCKNIVVDCPFMLQKICIIYCGISNSSPLIHSRYVEVRQKLQLKSLKLSIERFSAGLSRANLTHQATDTSPSIYRERWIIFKL